MTSDTDPVDDLGLDSQDGISWICDLEELGFWIPDNINPFRASKDRPDGSFKHRTVREIADLVYGLQKAKERNAE